MGSAKKLLIAGSVSHGFEPVREASIENFTHSAAIPAFTRGSAAKQRSTGASTDAGAFSLELAEPPSPAGA